MFNQLLNFCFLLQEEGFYLHEQAATPTGLKRTWCKW